MVEKMTFWRPVGIGFGVVLILTILFIILLQQVPLRSRDYHMLYDIFYSIAIIILLSPVIGGLIAGYLFKDGIIGGIKVGLPIGIFGVSVIASLLFLSNVTFFPGSGIGKGTVGFSVLNGFPSLLLHYVFFAPIGGAIGGLLAWKDKYASIMAEKKMLWPSVLIGAAMIPIVFFISALYGRFLTGVYIFNSYGPEIFGFFVVLLGPFLAPLFGGLIAGYLFRGGIIGRMKVGFVAGLFGGIIFLILLLGLNGFDEAPLVVSFVETISRSLEIFGAILSILIFQSRFEGFYRGVSYPFLYAFIFLVNGVFNGVLASIGGSISGLMDRWISFLKQ